MKSLALGVIFCAGVGASLLVASSWRTQPGILHRLHTPSGIEREVEADRLPEFAESYAHFLALRANANGLVDWDAYGRAVQARDSMPSYNPGASDDPDAGNWEFLGPNNMDVPFKQYFGSSRPTSGRVTALDWDPRDENIIWLASAGGGIWKSTDKGANWTSKSDTAWPMLQTGCIAIDRRNTDTVIAGTGGSRGFFRLYGYGIMKTTDGGSTWTNYNSFDGAPLKTSIIEILIHPDRSDWVYAITYGKQANNGTLELGKVYWSGNGGQTFVDIGPEGAIWNDISIGIKGPKSDANRALYISGFKPTGEQLVYVSTDDGDSWSPVTPPTFGNFAAANLGSASVHVEASPTDYRVAYAQSGTSRQIRRTGNRGLNWDDITFNYKNGDANYNWSQSGYDAYVRAFAVPGSGRDTVYSGLITVSGLDVIGSTWTDFGKAFEVVANQLHNDQHCITVNPRNPNEVLIGCDGGLYKTTFNPTTRTWGNIQFGFSGGLGITQFYGIAVHNSDRDKVLGGTQDNATPRSFGAVSPVDGLGANLNRWNNAAGGDGGTPFIDPLDDSLVYAVAGGNNASITRSSDGFAAIVPPGDANNYSLPIPFYPVVGETTLFLGQYAADIAGKRIFEVTNGWCYRYTKGAGVDPWGFRWDSARVDMTDPPNVGKFQYRLGPPSAVAAPNRGTLLVGIPNVVATAPGDENVVYIGTRSGKLYMARNATVSVQNVAFTEIQGGTNAIPAQPITAILVHPFDQNQVYVGVGGSGHGQGHLFWCPNVMATPRNWVQLGDAPLTDMDIPINTICLDPADPDNVVYVGNDVGAFISEDSAISWAKLTGPNKLPNVQVNDLKASAAGYLFAGTFGRGIYRTTAGSAKIVGFGVSPNPARGFTIGIGRVVLANPALGAGVIVAIQKSEPTAIRCPGSITIPAGQVEGIFPYFISPTTTAYTATFTVTALGESRTTRLRVTP